MYNPDTMMYKAVIFAVCASFLFVSGDAGDCRHPAPVEKFFASAYTALIVTNDPDFIDHFSMPGGEAGMHVYNVVKKVFDEAHLCNADEIAFLAGRSVARAGSMTLPRLFKNVVYTIGEELLKNKVLDCANAIPLAIEYFVFTKKESEGLDKRQLDSHILGLLKGYGDILAAHHLDLGPVSTDAVQVFAAISEDGSEKPKCQEKWGKKGERLDVWGLVELPNEEVNLAQKS
ncbi:hypothetical protein JTE90_003661 [Oedothorax gibbosus]|uniref:Uncharacterized protein n=1 Tax=Oedothorax gibbosus TaxID=931172 RepID=A0AAV6VRI4_9ARAC|nr:hypothetical protein JTE90_003661 [Oedothorax gibbosus]